MSLLRDALHARKGRENGQALAPAVFSGPVLDADELLGTIDESAAGEEADTISAPDSTDALCHALNNDTLNDTHYDDLESDALNRALNDTLSNARSDGLIDTQYNGDLDPSSASSHDEGFLLQLDEDPVAEAPKQTQQQSVQASGIGRSELIPELQQVAPQNAAVAPSPPQHRSENTQSERIEGELLADSNPVSSRQGSNQALAEEPTPNRDATAATVFPRSSMNLDPIFFIIVALAFAGLFGSLYAILTQNDAFVRRETAELNVWQNSLDGLSARNEHKGVEKGDQAIGEESVEAVAELAASNSPDHLPIDITADSSNNEFDTSQVRVAGKIESTPEAETSSKPVVSTVDIEKQPEPAVVNTTGHVALNDVAPAVSVVQQESQGGEQKIAALEAEVRELRQRLASQSLRISQIISENSALQQASVPMSHRVEGGSVDIKVGASPTVQSVAVSTPKKNDVNIDEQVKPARRISTSLESDGSRVPASSKASLELTSPPSQVQGMRVQDIRAQAARVQGTRKQNNRNQDTNVRVTDAEVFNIHRAGQHAANGVNIVDQPEEFPKIVGRAFHAYSSGDLKQASTLYERAVQLDPYNRDANLGVAAVAMKSGNYAAAIQRYRHLLSLHPDDAIAFSAMLNLAIATQNTAMENEMFVHSQQNSQIPTLHAALGNYYSQTSRWGKASQSYAAAVRLSPDTADYLYNLAVSLDNLGDSLSAIEAYDRAMSLSVVNPYTFSLVEASARLRELRSK